MDLSNGNDDDDVEVIGGMDPRFMAARDAEENEDDSPQQQQGYSRIHHQPTHQELLSWIVHREFPSVYRTQSR